MSSHASSSGVGRSSESKSSGSSKGRGRSSKDRKGKSTDVSKTPKNKPESGPLDLYCAVYRLVLGGNYYHWAFCLHDTAIDRWHVFQILQDSQDAPFTTSYRNVNPADSSSCVLPLTSLGQMHVGHWDTLVQQIEVIRVPDEAESWNCQDYFIDIWEIMR